MKDRGVGTFVILAVVAAVVVGAVGASLMLSGDGNGEENEGSVSVSSISAPSANVGENGNISVKITNSSGSSLSENISLEIDGEIVITKTVTIDGGGEKTVNFNVSRSSPGDCTLSVLDKSTTWSISMPSSRYLDVPHVPQSASICYLGCTTMLTKYYDQNLEISDIITYTGAATIFKDYTQTSIMNEEEEEEGEEDGDKGGERKKKIVPTDYSIVPPTIKNLGFTPHFEYVGQAKGFAIGLKEGNPSNSLSTENKLLNRLKEILASNHPAIVWLDNDAWWTKHFESITGGPEPLVAIGYDENNIYTHVATTAAADENQSIPIDKFSNGWGKEITPILLYLTKDGTKKTTAEILSDLKANAEKTPTNLIKTARGLENGAVSLGSPGIMWLGFNLQQYGALRENFAAFLNKQGYKNLATKYNNSSTKFWNANQSYEKTDGGGKAPTEVADILREIATIENQAYNLWN